MADGISQRAGRDDGRNRDLISALHDDLLLRILGLLPAASDAARTSILSRRWRSLWPNAPVLRFAIGETPKSTTSPTVGGSGGHSDRNDACWLISAATTAIARRTAAVGGPDVEDLQLHAADVTPEHVTTWLAFAARRVTGRPTLAVPPPELFADDGSFVDECDRQCLFAVLPSSVTAQQMSLTLGTAILAIPTTVAAGAFAALTDLLLSHAHLVGDGDGAGGHERRLSRLVSSSCCPRLWRLRLEYITGVAALRFGAASTLRELELYRVLDLRALDVDAPGLSVLRVEACHILAAARVSAPWLEVVTWKQLCWAGAPRLELDGAASVRCIEDLLMFSHWPTAWLDPQRHSYLTAPWFLIRHCTSVNQLSMTFIGISATAQVFLKIMMKDIPYHS
ncbi:unnamed protein product [Urochloa decumbens]|uniref:F-box domain-containing protein n=1 Tax=Urochloa decumbens TaxID=240449 RepID=A0ABC8WB81_9POAL